MPLSSTADTQAAGVLINYTTGAVNLAANASLHSAYSNSGANELTGTGPLGNPYARVALTWTNPVANSGQVVLTAGSYQFNVPPSSTVAFVGLWSGGGSPVFGGMGANGGATMYAFTSTRTADTPASTITAPGTGYNTNTQVVLWSGVGATLPTGVTLGNIYWVVNPSSASFQVSTTQNGSVVALGTSLGSGLVQAITVETFGAAGYFTLNSDTLSIT